MKRILRLILIVMILGVLYYGTRVTALRVPLIDRGISCISYSCLLAGQTITYPFRYVADFFAYANQAEAHVRELQSERDELVKQLVAARACCDVLTDCAELIDFKKRYETRAAVVTQIIAKQFLPDRHSFLIDAGSQRGIELDMVAVFKDCLVGRVTEVFPYYSRVTLITDPACKVAVSIKGAKDQGIHEGTLSLTQTRLTYMYDTHFELEKRLKPGDMVLSSGEGLVFPRGFAIGTICSINREDYNYLICIKPLVDFEHLSYCCVMAKGAEFVDATVQPVAKVAQPVKKVPEVKSATPKPVEAPAIQLPVQLPDPVETRAEIKQKPQEPEVPKSVPVSAVSERAGLDTSSDVASVEEQSQEAATKKSRRPRRRRWWWASEQDPANNELSAKSGE